MKNYYIELQDEEKACGAYCIYMILKHHGLNVELKEIKQNTRMDANGISMQGLLECLRHFQVEAKAYEASITDLKQVNLPCILHLLYGEYGHYVVLYEIKDEDYIIGDPKQGKVTMCEEELEKVYSHRMISILHIGRINTSEKTYLHFLKENFINYRYDIIQFLMRGLLLSLLSFLSSLFFEIIIDYLEMGTQYFYILILCLFYLLLQLVRIKSERTQSLNLVGMTRLLDEDYVLTSIENLKKMPMIFFNQESGYIHSQIISLYELSEMNVRLFENVLLNGLTIIFFMIVLLIIEPVLSLIVIMMFISIIIYIYFQVPIMKSLSSQFLEKYYQHHNDLLENIESIFLLKRFHYHTAYRSHYIDYALKKQEKNNKTIEMNRTISIIIQFYFSILLLYGLLCFLDETLSMGELIMSVMMISQILPSFISLVSLSFEYHTMKQLYERYKNFQYAEVEKEPIKERITSIRLDDLSFSYGYREYLFEHIDLTISRSMILKGESGSGKTTLLNLLMGFDLNYNGHIYMNDQELKMINLDSLYSHIGYENGTPQFFHGTLKENILSDDEDRIRELLKGFGCLEMIDLFTLTLNNDGSPLSQGQRQIVSLLRLFCRDYDVYILDECFSHLDNRQAGKIFRYLNKTFSDKILIWVNHQNNLVNKEFDCVIIENGKLQEKVMK